MDSARPSPESQQGPSSLPPGSQSGGALPSAATAFDAPPISVRAPASMSSRALMGSPAFAPPLSTPAPLSSPLSSTRGVPSHPAPMPSVRRGQGTIYQIVKMLDRKHGSFFISRLILTTGINLRTFDSSSYDDPVVLDKLGKALRTLLAPGELDGILQLLSTHRSDR